MKVDINDITFATGSVVDEAGKVFYYKGGVFRAIYNEDYSEIYQKILSSSWLGDVTAAGLIDTVVENDIEIDCVKLILQHKKLSFFVHPAEMTAHMHWDAAKVLLRVNLELVKYGYMTKDSHPWNLMIDRGVFKFIDFGSIVKAEVLPMHWLDEFRRYFGVPIWLASRGWHDFALEYRRQHVTGFGIKLFDLDIIKKCTTYSLIKLDGLRSSPVDFFPKIEKWLDNHKPSSTSKGNWGQYPQYKVSDNPLKPILPKQKFVFRNLERSRPQTVLDCAANNGYYSEMAARLGADVIAFDYEDYCVNECNALARREQLNITAVRMDFCYPTPPFAIGLAFDSSFVRFKSEIVLAIGLVHHVCLTQGLPVKIFCEICMNYAQEGIIFEYVDPTDFHIKDWPITPPSDYSLNAFIAHFSTKFPNIMDSYIVTDDGANRQFIYFHK